MPVIAVKLAGGASLLRRVDATGLTIGRSAECGLHLGDAALSREHASIVFDRGRWVLRDLGSRNGTLLNGQVAKGEAVLRFGDEIRLGTTSLVFADDEPADEVTARATRGRSEPAGLGPEDFVGTSAAAREVLRLVEIVAASDATVLVLGESGTGKELVASRLHRLSPRRGGPFIVVNCPAIPGALFESELFGIERGVATGVQARAGRLEGARGGTVFFDEVGELDGAAQAKLLRFLQERTIDRVGGRSAERIDVRVIAATNRDLEAEVAAGRFRADLLHRLSPFPIAVPPLRQRKTDIPQLIDAILRTRGHDAGIDGDAVARLIAHDFPGNVRELENVLERGLLLSLGQRIRLEHLPDRLRTTVATSQPADDVAAASLLEQVLRGASFWTVVRDAYLSRAVSKAQASLMIAQALERSGGSYKEMSRLLGVGAEYKRLMNFLRNHGLQPRDRS